MTVVVRCAGCGGLARVGPEAVGLLVVCPRCGDPFLADPVTEAPAPPPPPPPPPRPLRAQPVAPPRARRRPPRAAPEVHDHPPVTAGGVPFSVIIGLALLPLTIPLLWLIGPTAVGLRPALTLATPVSLAVSAAVLCLAVAYTVDWTPVTRIKGVLTLVGLAYFAGLSLYFLKKETAEWAQQKLAPGDRWHDFRPPDEGYAVKLPGPAAPVPAAAPAWPVPALQLPCYKASLKGFNRTVVFTVGGGKDHDPGEKDDREWFAAVERSLRGANREVTALDDPPGERLACREWKVDGKDTLLVRVYRANGRVYLLTAQGPDLEPDDDDVARFFNSFTLAAAK